MVVGLISVFVFVVCIVFLVWLIRDDDAPTRRAARVARMELRWQRDVVQLLEQIKRDDDQIPFMTDKERAETQRLLDAFYRS